MQKKDKKFLKIFKKVVTVTLLVFIIFVGYCKISELVYYKKGPNYEPAFSIYTISSTSMKPALNKYDLVINSKIKDQSNIEIGDIITFISTNMNFQGKPVTHRVEGFSIDEKSRVCYITKGDNNEDRDKSCAKQGNIIGKVIIRIPFVGIVGTPYGLAFVIIIILIINIVKRIKKKAPLKNQRYNI